MTDRSVYVSFVLMKDRNEYPGKREEIILVASRLFYEQGYHRTGVQQIIEEAGAAKGTFYTHFKSKEDLGVAWLKARHETWNRWLDESLAGKRGAKARLLGIFDFLGKWLPQSGYRGCAFLNTLAEIPDAESPLRQEIAHHKLELRERFIALVDEHHAGKPRPEREHIASTLFLLFEGTLIEIQNFRDLWPLKSAKKEVQALLANS